MVSASFYIFNFPIILLVYLVYFRLEFNYIFKIYIFLWVLCGLHLILYLFYIKLFRLFYEVDQLIFKRFKNYIIFTGLFNIVFINIFQFSGVFFMDFLYVTILILLIKPMAEIPWPDLLYISNSSEL